MKRTILFFLLSTIAINAQTNFEISVIDSFKWTNYNGEGIEAADAAVFNSSIYLSYYYSPDASNKRYVFCAKKDHGVFIVDTVAAFVQDYYNHHRATAIQIDSLGNPWIYYQYGGDIFASRKLNGKWVTNQIVSNLLINGIATFESNGNEMGLFYKGATSQAQTSFGLMFVHWKNNAWETKILFEQPSGWRDPSPSALQVGNDIYVSFVTVSGSPDSIIVHVLKGNNGNWTEDFSDIVVTQLGGVYISERGMLGKSQDGTIFLWREYGQTDLGEDLGWRLFKKDANGWKKVLLNSPPNGFMAWPQSSNIVVTKNGIVVMISEANGFNPKISWAKPDGTCGINEELPYWNWSPFALWLQDIITINDDIYIYYTNGAPGNYDYPVTFKEAKINIEELLTSIDNEKIKLSEEFTLFQNYPNPFNPTTTIKYTIPGTNEKFSPLAKNVVLKVYDILGNEITTLVNEVKQPGIYEISFNATQLSSGVYYYKLTINNFTKVRKMVLIK